MRLILNMVGEAGLEPTTPGLEGRCSIQLSYSPLLIIVASTAHLKLRRVKLFAWPGYAPVSRAAST